MQNQYKNLDFLDSQRKEIDLAYAPLFSLGNPLFGQHQSMVDQFSKSHKYLPTTEGCGQLAMLADVR